MPLEMTVKIDVTKIDKTHLFLGSKGTYLDIAMISNHDGTDQYGNDGFVTQGVSKDARERGERGPIIGNFRWRNNTQQSTPEPAQADNYDDVIPDDSNMPF